MVKINPIILGWARETAGYSIEEACKRLGIKDNKELSAINRLNALESGQITPSRSMLQKMAKQYHRPLIVFYMSNPPRKGNRGQDYRTLTTVLPNESDAFVDALLRNIQARQGILRASLEEDEEVSILSFVNSISINETMNNVINSIINTLNFDINIFRKRPTAHDAFTYLRSCAESAGIFVLLIGDLGSYHTSLDIESFRGFALSDNLAPFIVINDHDSKAALSFTLLHEIVHIWLGQTGVSNSFYDNIIEKYCNDIAGEILLSGKDLDKLRIDINLSFEEVRDIVAKFAEKNNVSCSMVAYKLFRGGKINHDIWKNISQYYLFLWKQNKTNERSKARQIKGGPDYFTIQRHLVGVNTISTVQRMLTGGTLTTTKAGKVLGVKAKNVQKLLQNNKNLKVSNIH